MSGPTFPGAADASRAEVGRADAGRAVGGPSEAAEASASGGAGAMADAAEAQKRSLAGGAADSGQPAGGLPSETAAPAMDAAVPAAQVLDAAVPAAQALKATVPVTQAVEAVVPVAQAVDAAVPVASPFPGPVVAPLVPASMRADQLPPVVLAYIGDAVFEVYVRQYLIANIVRKPHELHRASTRYVSAAAQAKLLRRWMPLLTEEEADIARRGRNAKSGQPPKNADPGEYRHATGLECLVGYLYYRGERDRLEWLIGLAFADDPTTSEKGPDHHE